MITLDLGDVAVITGTFDPDAPSAHQLVIRDPLGVETVSTSGVVLGDTVTYESALLTVHGTYECRLRGTAGAIGSETFWFKVRPTKITTAVS